MLCLEEERLCPEIIVILKQEAVVLDVHASRLLLDLVCKDIHSVVFTIEIQLDMVIMYRIR